jgi:hypothetical protein
VPSPLQAYVYPVISFGAYASNGVVAVVVKLQFRGDSPRAKDVVVFEALGRRDTQIAHSQCYKGGRFYLLGVGDGTLFVHSRHLLRTGAGKFAPVISAQTTNFDDTPVLKKARTAR